MKRLKRLWQFQKIETAKTICNIILKPVFDAESHGELCFGSFCCFEVENFHNPMIQRAHPVTKTAKLRRPFKNERSCPS